MQINQSKKILEFFEKVFSPRKIDFLVLHHIEANSVEHVIDQLLEHKVSAHFLIDESGKIFELVDENDIAYHAGVSFWRGCDGVNKNSIGIEFINSAPFTKKFEAAQMQAGVELCKYLIAKYGIEARNVVGHSDVAYFSKHTLRQAQDDNSDDLVGGGKNSVMLSLSKHDCIEECLNRKQDPSHLFDWKFLAKNGVGIFPKFSVGKKFKLGDKNPEIKKIKENLREFGYRVVNLNDEFDEEMQALTRVFNRRFLGEESDIWSLELMSC